MSDLIKEKGNLCITWIKQHILTSVLFLSITLFFILQHYFAFNWDFAAYVMNAKYLFYSGTYYEVYRAPLISLILGSVLFLGKLAEYLYIIAVSILFLFTSMKLSGVLFEKYFSRYKVEKRTVQFLFYLFSLNLFVMSYGVNVGTELLALSFFELFLTYFMMNKNSGHFLALAFLSRYNFFIFVPFLLFNRSLKKVLKNLGLFFLVVFPWMLFNKIHWGNWFTSIVEAFYLNVFTRLDRVEPFQISQLFPVINWFLPFLLLGLIVPVVLFIASKKKKVSDLKYELFFSLIYLFFLYDIYSIPFKVSRYTFNMVLPIAFFSTIGAIFIIKGLNKKKYQKIFSYLLIIGFFICLILVAKSSIEVRAVDRVYADSAATIKDLGLQDCRVLSSHWVPVSYYSENVAFLIYRIDEALRRNEIVLIFPQYATIDDRFNLSELDNYPARFKNENYILIANKDTTGENCAKWEGENSPLIKNHCEILSKKFSNDLIRDFSRDVCNLLNFHSFK